MKSTGSFLCVLCIQHSFCYASSNFLHFCIRFWHWSFVLVHLCRFISRVEEVLNDWKLIGCRAGKPPEKVITYDYSYTNDVHEMMYAEVNGVDVNRANTPPAAGKRRVRRLTSLISSSPLRITVWNRSQQIVMAGMNQRKVRLAFDLISWALTSSACVELSSAFRCVSAGHAGPALHEQWLSSSSALSGQMVRSSVRLRQILQSNPYSNMMQFDV